MTKMVSLPLELVQSLVNQVDHCLLGYSIKKVDIKDAMSELGRVSDAVSQACVRSSSSTPSHTFRTGLQTLRSIASQLGSEDDKDSEKCIIECVEIIEESLPVPTQEMWETFDSYNGDKKMSYETWMKAWADTMKTALKI